MAYGLEFTRRCMHEPIMTHFIVAYMNENELFLIVQITISEH